MLKLCADNRITAREKDFSLTEVYDADEAFITGTFAGLTPVAMVDGRTIGDGRMPGPMTAKLRNLYGDLIERECPAP